jgi:hypothetical protein
MSSKWEREQAADLAKRIAEGDAREIAAMVYALETLARVAPELRDLGDKSDEEIVKDAHTRLWMVRFDIVVRFDARRVLSGEWEKSPDWDRSLLDLGTGLPVGGDNPSSWRDLTVRVHTIARWAVETAEQYKRFATDLVEVWSEAWNANYAQ